MIFSNPAAGVVGVLDNSEPGQCWAVCQLSGSDGRDVSPWWWRPGCPTHLLSRCPERDLVQPQSVLLHVEPQSRQHTLADRPRSRRCRPRDGDRIQRLPEHGGSTWSPRIGVACGKTPRRQRETWHIRGLRQWPEQTGHFRLEWSFAFTEGLHLTMHWTVKLTDY